MRFIIQLFTLFCAMMVAPLGHTSDRICAIDGAIDEDTRYNEAFLPTCHNCYETQYASTFSSVLDSASNVEIDLWSKWTVGHTVPATSNSNCSGDGDLGDCLSDVKTWSDENPNHRVITIFIDKKTPWEKPSESPKNLDDLLTETLGSKLFKPSDFRDEENTLRAKIANDGWPTVSSLSGKIMVVLTGGSAGRHNQTQSKYLETRGNDTAMFIAPDFDDLDDVDGTPTGVDKNFKDDIIFGNIKYSNNDEDVVAAAFDKRIISRVWGAEKEDAGICNLLSHCANAPALYNWKSNCHNHSEGKLVFTDLNDWSDKEKESKFEKTCSSTEIMAGRQHDGDENGKTRIYCKEIVKDAIPFIPHDPQWEESIKESSGTFFSCPQNTVMTGMKHTGDENGKTKYQCSKVTYDGQSVSIVKAETNAIKAIVSGDWSAPEDEDDSKFTCPSNQVLHGRFHTGDENGSTSYACTELSAPN